jgi:hypothetical protein
MNDKTNITELARFFPANGSAPLYRSKTAKVTAVASRYWLPGDTYQQALARQEQARAELDAKIKARNI